MNTVYAVCYGFFGRAADAEDATQETFIRLIRYDGTFNDEEHMKAWLIRVASNVCKDVLKSADVSKRANLAPEDVEAATSASAAAAAAAGGAKGLGEGSTKAIATGSTQLSLSVEEQYDSTLEVVLALPEKYKDIVLLYYYEGYTAAEVAEMLEKPPSTVRNLLADAREILREQLGGDWA